MENMAAAEPGVLEQITECVEKNANKGSLEAGTEVLVVHEGQLQRARVRPRAKASQRADRARALRSSPSKPGLLASPSASALQTRWDEQYTVSVWTEVYSLGKPYEVGFDTSDPTILTVPRSKLYAQEMPKQKLSTAALEMARQ
eukprot:5534793-Prymnesium_polylepis.1